MYNKSKKLYDVAKTLIPSGVNSPVRYFKPYPLFFTRAKNDIIWDKDNNHYIDLCNCYGALLLGHCKKEIILSVKNQLKLGTLFCSPTELELDLTKLIMHHYPSMQKIRLVNTGTEATMTAIRLLCGYTNKNKIIKFEGCYHGSYDPVLVKSGSGYADLNNHEYVNDISKNTIVLQYNDLSNFNDVLESNDDIACVIVEPILANMGLILPQKNFLVELRKITKNHNIPLIFDEIVTGFRISPGGFQQISGISPDITLLGKILGHGFPIAAIGGKKKFMDCLAPLGNVYQASTFAGNPVSVSASIALIKTINKYQNKIYSKLEKTCNLIVSALDDIATDKKISHQINSVASMFQFFFTNKPVINYNTAKTSNTLKFHNLFTTLLKHGIFIPPSQFETIFISYAHTNENIKKIIEAYEKSFRFIKN